MRGILLVVLATLVVAHCGASPFTPGPVPGVTAFPKTTALVGAGDIAVCDEGLKNAEATAALLDQIQGTVITFGDLAYPDGTRTDFEQCYASTWGRHKSRTKPSPGNHEYNTPGAAPYYEYFGNEAGPAGLGYYAFQSGAWQVLSLNSNIAANVGSPQYEWVKNELARNTSRCTIAYWHYPVFSSGFDGDVPAMRAIWRLLYEHGAELVLAGHAHNYERVAPKDGDGRVDRERGIRQFVVGTGGAPKTDLVRPTADSEVWTTEVFGVIKLTLYDDSYDWEFISTADRPFRDAGHDTCH